MNQIPYIPENAPFTAEQRAWLNGFLAGLYAHGPGAPAALPVATPAKRGEPLLVLFGSQTGTAEGLAKKIAKESEQRGFSPSVLALDEYEKANLPAAEKAIIISSTWGDGEPPDNAVNFWSWLNADSAPRLENLKFAVLGLGDKNYSEFCGASKKFDSRLEALGARRLLPRGECDVDYETAAKAWTDSLWKEITEPGQGNTNPAIANGPVNGSVNGHSRNGSGYSKTNPFPARLLTRRLLNGAGSAKEVYHHEINLRDSGLTYEAGDALGIVPQNCPSLVNALLAALNCSGNEAIKIGETTSSLRDAFTSHYEITRPTTDLLAHIGRVAQDSALAPLLAPERSDDLKKWLWGRDLLDVIALVPSFCVRGIASVASENLRRVFTAFPPAQRRTRTKFI